jgi:hypothetical protein
MERWPETDIEYLRPNKKLIKKVAGAVKKIEKKNNKNNFLQSGDVKLRPIFDLLGEKVNYEDIKLSLLFIDKKDLLE